MLLRRKKFIQLLIISIDFVAERLDVLGDSHNILFEIRLIPSDVALLVLPVLLTELGLEVLEDCIVDIAEIVELLLDTS